MKYTVQPKGEIKWHYRGVPSPLPTITLICSITWICFYLCVCGGVLSSLPFFAFPLPLPSPSRFPSARSLFLTPPIPLPFCLPLCSENFYGVSQVLYKTITEILDEVTSNVLPSRITFSIGRHRDNQQITLLLLGFDTWLCKGWPVLGHILKVLLLFLSMVLLSALMRVSVLMRFGMVWTPAYSP